MVQLQFHFCIMTFRREREEESFCRRKNMTVHSAREIKIHTPVRPSCKLFTSGHQTHYYIDMLWTVLQDNGFPSIWSGNSLQRLHQNIHSKDTSSQPSFEINPEIGWLPMTCKTTYILTLESTNNNPGRFRKQNCEVRFMKKGHGLK